jgi:2Fe-2S ferredoxin
MKSKLFFKPADRTVEVESGTTILDAALDAEIDINYDCGGNCACSTCHIIVEEGMANLNDRTEDEVDLLEDVEGVTEFSRLACQCEIDGDLVLTIPQTV